MVDPFVFPHPIDLHLVLARQGRKKTGKKKGGREAKPRVVERVAA